MKSLIGTCLAAALILALTADTASARGGSQGMRGRGGASQQAFGGGYAALLQQQQLQQRLQLQMRLQQQYRMRAGGGLGQYPTAGVPGGIPTYRMQGGGGTGQCPMGNAGGGLQQGAQHRYGASQGGGTRQRIRTPDAVAP
jgi:hypothetical protein